MRKILNHDQTFFLVADCVEGETGHRPHPATCWRWTKKGRVVNGRRFLLKTQMHGGRRKTKPAWVRQFFEALTEATTPRQAADADRVSAELQRELA